VAWTLTRTLHDSELKSVPLISGVLGTVCRDSLHPGQHSMARGWIFSTTGLNTSLQLCQHRDIWLLSPRAQHLKHAQVISGALFPNVPAQVLHPGHVSLCEGTLWKVGRELLCHSTSSRFNNSSGIVSQAAMHYFSRPVPSSVIIPTIFTRRPRRDMLPPDNHQQKIATK